MTKDRIEDEWRIRRTLERYCRAVDDADNVGIVGVFATDAVIDIGGESLRGEEAISEYYSRHGKPGARPIGVHLLGNCIVEFEGDDDARAETDFLQVWRVGEGSGEDAAAVIGGSLRSEIPVAGRYIDRMRREAAGWRIAAIDPPVRHHALQGDVVTEAQPSTEVRLRVAFTVALDRLDEFQILFSQSVTDSLGEVGDPDNGTIGYSAFLDRESGRVVAYEHHADVPALLAHLARNPDRRKLMAPMFDGAPELELYGEPTPELLEVLTTLRLTPMVFGECLGVSGAL